MPSATATKRFAQVDVFTDRAGFGNPVAVVLDAEGLDTEAMARFANWTNLSETTFVLPPTGAADYRVRIFTPSVELPFAGHPTLGTCRALIDAGVIPDRGQWVQECEGGLIDIRGGADGALSFQAPKALVSDSPIEPGEISAVIGGLAPADPLLIDVGPRWLTGRVGLTELDGLQVDPLGYLKTFAPELATGLNLYAVDGDQVHVRSFFDGGGALAEDPVCGSGNAAVGVHLIATGHQGDVPATYQARQGRHRGRDGRIQVTLGDRVWVGGPAVTVITGAVDLG